MNSPDIDLILSAGQNPDQFNQLVDLYTPRVYQWLCRLTANEEDIKDIMQEAFIKLYRDLPKLAEPEKFNGWFRKLVIHTAYDWFRKFRKKYELPDLENLLESVPQTGASVPELAENRQLGALIKSAIDKLSANNRIVYSLFYEQDQKCADIARMLNLSETAVKNRLSRAREHLKKELRPLVLNDYIENARAFKILIICSSHKKGGISYEIAERVKGSVLKISPASAITILELANFELASCKVCNPCESLNRRHCGIGDGFDQIFEQCIAADVIVFVAPYYAPIPSKLSALLERMMSISITPAYSGANPGRAFPLQKKWCAVLNFSIVKQQGYLAGIIREPLVSMGLGLIITEDKLPPDASIETHADLLGRSIIDKLLLTPESDPIENWFDYWNKANLKIMDLVRQNEYQKLK